MRWDSGRVRCVDVGAHVGSRGDVARGTENSQKRLQSQTARLGLDSDGGDSTLVLSPR